MRHITFITIRVSNKGYPLLSMYEHEATLSIHGHIASAVCRYGRGDNHTSRTHARDFNGIDQPILLPLVELETFGHLVFV